MIRFFVRLFLLVIVAVLVFLVWAVWPRTGNLRDFDADAVARLETVMWRDHYERDYTDLWLQLYRLHQREYHFSPMQSYQLATSAAQAAKALGLTRRTILYYHSGAKPIPIYIALACEGWEHRQLKAA